MKLRTVVLLTLVAFCLGNSVMAFSYNYAALNAVSSNPFDGDNNTSPVDYGGSIGFLPSPGTSGAIGGEQYDLEGFNVTFDVDFMYVSLTNSYGEVAYGGFRQGDVFFGGSYGSNDYAIDISTGQLKSVGGAWSYIQNVGGSYYHNVTIRNRVGAHEVTGGSILGSANQYMKLWSGLENNVAYAPTGPLLPDGTSGDTYVFEWKIARNILAFGDQDQIFFHATVGCGNDLIEREYPGIPEPGTLMLLGIGLLGAGAIKYRR